MDEIRMNLLKEVADLDALPVGAYNIRENGKAAGRNTTANIDIVTKKDKPGIDIIIAPGTKKRVSTSRSLFLRPVSQILCIMISTSARMLTS